MLAFSAHTVRSPDTAGCQTLVHAPSVFPALRPHAASGSMKLSGRSRAITNGGIQGAGLTPARRAISWALHLPRMASASRRISSGDGSGCRLSSKRARFTIVVPLPFCSWPEGGVPNWTARREVMDAPFGSRQSSYARRKKLVSIFSENCVVVGINGPRIPHLVGLRSRLVIVLRPMMVMRDALLSGFQHPSNVERHSQAVTETVANHVSRTAANAAVPSPAGSRLGCRFD